MGECPVTLQSMANEQLKEVAASIVISPIQKLMHDVALSTDLARLKVSMVFNGLEDVDPREQSQGAGEGTQMKIIDCLRWPIR